ncbi:ASCH domain-containing protein [Pontibacillus salicampi]|uniref:ASCH domain-containing protein n=1 Tax=Pontibacillus salicampi TaxID=1449801 RepID=A0ABV6LKT0_9BACI
MNDKAKQYWHYFWDTQRKDAPEEVTAWQFGTEPDYLAELVVKGFKTATCSAFVFYEVEEEPLPTIGQYNIILNSKEEPVAIIQTTSVDITPMNEVPEEFAWEEGEGDRSYQHWKKVHEAFFKEELETIGYRYQEDMLVVCERFKLVDVNP